MITEREQGDFSIKELDHTTAEDIENNVDEVKDARGQDEWGTAFATLNARLNYLEEMCRRAFPCIVACTAEQYAEMTHYDNLLYVIVYNGEEQQSVSFANGPITPEILAEVERVGAKLYQGGIELTNG